MHRLAQFQHHVLGDVDQQRDRTHATAAQALGHPQWGLGGSVDALDHTAQITRRFGASVELDGQLTAAGSRNGVGGEISTSLRVAAATS